MTVQRDGHRLLACKMRIFPTNKQRQIAVISIRVPHFPGNICLFSCITETSRISENHTLHELKTPLILKRHHM